MPLAVCATPIGNLEDVTLRVLAELREADVVLCEDTRHTRGLLERHGIKARLLSYHEHNEAARTAELLPRLEAGERIALVSDAGMPGVSDPGARIVRAALDAGVPVTVLPGPSAVETALVASGLVGARYQFLGFLPRAEPARAALWEELRAWPWPAVAFESPHRLSATLRSLAAADPGAAGRRLPRADEALRGGGARHGRGAGGAARGAAEGGGHARDRRRRSPRRRSRARARRSRRWPSWSTPACRASGPRRSCRGSPALRATGSIAARCSQN